MEKNYIKDISDFIKANYGGNITGEEISKDELLFERGILDSFGMVELISFLESKYGITFDTEDLVRDNLMTIEAIAGLLERKLVK